jgi:cyclopropane fatty-acyl-phospholipid synthase-like methyltransferase
MVFHNNVREVREQYEQYVGKADIMSSTQAHDTDAALAMARLREGENVLDLGTCSGRIVAGAKLKVGGGICVAVDAVQGFLDTDVAARLAQEGLTRAPGGRDDQKVFLLTASATQGDLSNLIDARVGRPVKFHVVFAIHLFETIAPRQRRQALQTWKKMLAPGGRLIVNMSPSFSSTAPTQFTPDATEAPGCVFVVRYDAGKKPTKLLAQDRLVATPEVVAAVQVSPDSLWTEARR